MGIGHLEVDADTPELTRRFQEVLCECRDVSPGGAIPVVACRARRVPGARIVWARFESAIHVDALPFVLHVFPDRGYREV
ncbi:MAG TPA: hypothetical protein VFM29_02550, partial [Vicinamibacteria bacterium]|nr:hypothetical protein [Vicinamibacteria bacterium]